MLKKPKLLNGFQGGRIQGRQLCEVERDGEEFAEVVAHPPAPCQPMHLGVSVLSLLLGSL